MGEGTFANQSSTLIWHRLVAMVVLVAVRLFRNRLRSEVGHHLTDGLVGEEYRGSDTLRYTS